MSRSLARSLTFVVACLAILFTQITAAGAAGGTLDRRLDDDDFAESVEEIAEEIDAFWIDGYSGSNFPYESPEIVLVDGKISTDCGSVEPGDGSLACPEDQTIYLDVESLAAVADEHGSIPAVVEIARVFAHHIDDIDAKADEAAGSDPADPRQLEADCFTGVWLVLAELLDLMPLGTTSEIVSYLVTTTGESDDSAHPGSLRVEHFLSGYYNQECG